MIWILNELGNGRNHFVSENVRKTIKKAQICVWCLLIKWKVEAVLGEEWIEF